MPNPSVDGVQCHLPKVSRASDKFSNLRRKLLAARVSYGMRFGPWFPTPPNDFADVDNPLPLTRQTGHGRYDAWAYLPSAARLQADSYGVAVSAVLAGGDIGERVHRGSVPGTGGSRISPVSSRCAPGVLPEFRSTQNMEGTGSEG